MNTTISSLQTRNSAVLVRVAFLGLCFSWLSAAQSAGVSEGIFAHKSAAPEKSRTTEQTFSLHERHAGRGGVPRKDGIGRGGDVLSAVRISGADGPSGSPNTRRQPTPAAEASDFNVPINSGTTASFSLPVVSASTLFTGDYGFTVTVPPDSSRLEIDMAAATSGVNLNLYVRYGQDINLDQNGYVIADYASNTTGGVQSIVVTPPSGLRAGVYYVGFGLLTTGVAVTGTLSVNTGGVTCAPSLLNSSFRLPPVAVSTLFTGDYGFQVVVPPGASQLEIQLIASTPNVDMHLYARAGQDIALDQNGYVIADYFSNASGGTQSIVITPATGLQSGVYYIGFGLFTPNVAVSATVTATASGVDCAGYTLLDSLFALPAVEVSTLFTGGYGFQVTIPPGVSQIQISMDSSTPNVELQLYARLGQDVALDQNGYVIADYFSNSPGTSQTFVITAPPGQQGGTYYIGFGLFTTGVGVNGRIQAVVLK